jgi:glutamine amidotransferase
VSEPLRAAIIDFGGGNLYNVRRACVQASIDATITDSPEAALEADAVILPGIGAMGEAMKSLHEKGLDEAVREIARRGTPIFGVCLGMQILMSEGTEFNTHAGLGLIEGKVIRFPHKDTGGAQLRVPHIGWNAIEPSAGSSVSWSDTPLAGTAPGEHFYFVHSFHVMPEDNSVILARTNYGGIEFPSAIASANIFACQFHPERSGPAGLEIYRQFASHAARSIAQARR